MARKTVKTTKTPEERRAQAEALQASIADQVDQLRGSDAWQRFLDFSQAFHAYSLNNVLLILSQNPNATRVAGFRKWQELGRQVRKGERAIKIFGFAQRPAKAAEGEGGMDAQQVAQYIATNIKVPEEGGRKMVTYFPMVSVFDIGQTDAIEGAPELPEITRRLDGEDELGIYAAAADYLTELGWTVTREAIPGETNGYTATDGSRRVVVDEALSPAQAAKTIIHEAGHVLLHAEEDHAEYVAHRGIKETEAESVAYVVAGVLGMDTSDYSIGYVAGWSDGDTEVIKATAANVLRAAHKIADAITDASEAAVAA